MKIELEVTAEKHGQLKDYLEEIIKLVPKTKLTSVIGEMNELYLFFDAIERQMRPKAYRIPASRAD